MAAFTTKVEGRLRESLLLCGKIEGRSPESQLLRTKVEGWHGQPPLLPRKVERLSREWQLSGSRRPWADFGDQLDVF